MDAGRGNGATSQLLALSPVEEPTLTVNTLGRLDIRWGGRAVTALKFRKTQALLVYLALTPGRHDRGRLAGLLWGDLPEEHARRNLRHAVWSLRQQLAPAVLESDRLSVGLSAHIPCQVDALAFEAEIEQAEHCQQAGEPAAAIGHLEAAIALYQGDFLAQFDLPGCVEFEEWVMRRRAWLRERALEALICLVAYYTQRGQYRRASRYARQQLTLDPWREEAHRQLMLLLALTGQRSAALAQYEKCRRLLAEELGLEPLEETTALYGRLVNWEIGKLVDWETGELGVGEASVPVYQSTNLPFAGRGAEHATLVDWWERAQRGEGRLTLLEGEAGVGKTRLVEEVARYAETQGAIVLRGRCYEFGGAVPYQAIADALRSALKWGDKNAERQEGGWKSHPLTTSLPTPLPLSLSPIWLAELARLLPELRQAYPNLPEPLQVSGETARQRLFEAVARFLSVNATNPLFFFLDDLHWADQSTLDLLHYLVRRLTGVPVGIVGTYRPEEVSLSHPLTRLRQGLSRDHLVNHLVLGPLSAGAVEEIALSLVGEEGGAAFGAFLYCESEGNPLILVEMVNSLQEQGVLRGGEAGRWQWSGPPATVTLPLSVQDVILQRVGRLTEPAQRLLTLAAVIGHRFDLPLLRAAAGPDASAVDASLDEWLTRRLVKPAATGTPVRDPSIRHSLDFSHDKIRTVVYHTAGAAQRRMLHQRVGEALEQLPPERIEEQAGLLAYHWEQAREPAKATEYLLRAGDQARLVYAHQEAIDYYRRALAYLKERGEHERAARTLMKLGLTHHNALDFRRARQAYDEGLALWQRTGTVQPAPPLPPAPHALRVRWLEPTTLDPTMSADGHTSCLIAHLFSGLVELSPEMDVVPDVARTWEISEGGRKYIFHLRNDVRWSDGALVTARDFEYAWKRALDPATGSLTAAFLYDLQGGRAYHRARGGREDVGVRALDDLTLLVELERPVGHFLHLLTHVSWYPVPQHAVEAHGAAWTEEGNLVTNGPFRLEAWRRGEEMLLTRNPIYHGRFGGNVERVELFPLTDWSARLRMYEADGLDVLSIVFFPPAERERARQRHSGEYVSVPRLETHFLAFDVHRPPFNEVRVRRAFALATDREALAEVVMQGAVAPATGGLVPPGMPGHSPGIALPYAPQQARRLLAEAGYPGGHGFPGVKALAYHAIASRSEYLQAQWRESLGVEIAWETVGWAEFLDRLQSDPPHLTNLGWVADYPDPESFLRVSRARSWAGWQSATYDQLVEEARQTICQEERMELYRQADSILVEEVPVLPLIYERDHLLIKPWVRHYPMTASHAVFWKDVVIAPHT